MLILLSSNLISAQSDIVDLNMQLMLSAVMWSNFLSAGTAIPPLAIVMVDEGVWAIMDKGRPIILYRQRYYYVVKQGKNWGYGVPLQSNPKPKEKPLVDPNTNIIRFQVRSA